MRYGIGANTGIGGNNPGGAVVGGDAYGPDSNGSFTPATTALRSGAGEVMSGRISLIMLDTLILGLIGFYLWTHSVQRGG